MNTQVTATGMSVTTKVTSSLLISETTTEADFTTTINQTREGILEPVSTTNGTSFFYHATATNVAASGKQSDNVFVLIAKQQPSQMRMPGKPVTMLDLISNIYDFFAVIVTNYNFIFLHFFEFSV